MTAFEITPERILTAIEMFPKHIQVQILIDRMTVYTGHGAIMTEGGEFKHIHMDNPEDVEEMLKIKLNAMRRAKTVGEVFWFINKPDRLQIFDILARTYVFRKEDYARILRNIWISTEFPGQTKNEELIRIFGSADQKYLMTEEDYKALSEMPEEITIYRGCQDKKAKVKGMSWTTAFEKANWFATRWHKGSDAGKVYTAQIKKSDVYMYCTERGEEEVVVNPNRLKGLKQVKTNI